MVKNIRKQIAKLADKDPSARRKAAEELAEGDERAIYPLIKALADENAGVQDAAMRSLIAIGSEVAGYMVLPLLREGTFLRNTALIILKELDGVAVPLLYPLLRDKDDDIRKFAVDLLGEIGKGADPLAILPHLRDPNANVRAAAAKTLSRLEYKGAAPELVRALGDDEWVCFSALEALGDLNACEAIEQIAALLSHSSEAIRFAAIETLGKLGSEKSVGVLRAYVPEASGDEKNAVIKSLIQIGITPEMADLADHLISMLREGDWEEREIALKGLVALNCKRAVPVMVDIAGALDPSLPGGEERMALLKHSICAIDSEEELLLLLGSDEIKYRGKSFAIEILGETRSRKAVQRLIGYLDDMRRDLRRASTQALGAIGASESIEHLLEASQRDVDAHVRRSAIEALGEIQSKEAFQPLLELLEVERYGDVIEKIVVALLKIDDKAFLSKITDFGDVVRETAVRLMTDTALLLKFVEDTNKKVRIAALYGLGRTGTDEAASVLVSFLRDADLDMRKAAVVGLGEAKCCHPELLNALKDTDPWVRFYAIKAIAFSCGKEKAVGILGAVLTDEFIPAVMAAIDAIKAIGGREAFEALAAHEDHANAAVRERIREALNSL